MSYQINLHQAGHMLQLTLFWVCLSIGVAVCSALLYSLIKHRKLQDTKTKHFHKRISTEIIWAIIPFVILILLATPAIKILLN